MMDRVADGDVPIGDRRIVAKTNIVNRFGEAVGGKLLEEWKPEGRVFGVPVGESLAGCRRFWGTRRLFGKVPAYQRVQEPQFTHDDMARQFERGHGLLAGLVMFVVERHGREDFLRDGLLRLDLWQQKVAE